MIRHPLLAPALAPALALALSLSTLAHADPSKETITICADAAEKGQELRAKQKLVSARDNFVRCAQRDCPTAVRDSCTEWLADLDKRLPSLVLRAQDPDGTDVREVTATLDGAPLPNLVTSAAVPADPGPHSLHCEAPGFEPVDTKLVLREGEPLRVVSVKLHRIGSAAPIGPSPPRSRPFPIVPVVLAGVSLVALGIFGVAAATGASDYHSLESDCAPHCSTDRIDGVRTRFVVADIALVAGIVMGAGALGLFLFDRPAARDVRR